MTNDPLLDMCPMCGTPLEVPHAVHIFDCPIANAGSPDLMMNGIEQTLKNLAENDAEGA